MPLREKFWEKYALSELTPEEWEALCDGCGRCCLLKFEEEGSPQVYFTSVACRLFDGELCRCKHYEARSKIVPDCIELTPETINENFDCLPQTCAYRLRHNGDPLYRWHYLVSGDRNDVHRFGISVRHRTVSEREVDTEQLDNFVIEGV